MYLDQSVTTSLKRGLTHLGPTPSDKLPLLSANAFLLMELLQRIYLESIVNVRRSTPRSGTMLAASWNSSLRSLLDIDTQVDVDGMWISSGVFDLSVYVISNLEVLNTGAAPLTMTLTQPTGRAEMELWGAVLAATHRVLGLAPGSLRLRRRRFPTKKQRARTRAGDNEKNPADTTVRLLA